MKAAASVSSAALSFPALAACFLLSGAAGLAYEMVWTRRLVLVFGSTTLGVSTVLAVYMGGLALGSGVAGRWADRPGCRRVRLYAGLEFAVGLYALFTPWIFDAVDRVYLAACLALNPDFALSLGLRLGGAVVALLVPTVLLGATLPVLARALVAEGEHQTERLSLLYAANLFGAVIGVLLTVLWALPTLGLAATNLLAALANALVAALAWHLGGAESSPAAPRGASAPALSSPSPAAAGEGGGEGMSAPPTASASARSRPRSAAAPRSVSAPAPSSPSPAAPRSVSAPALSSPSPAAAGEGGGEGMLAPPTATAPARPSAPLSPRHAALLALFAAAGFVSFLYEVAWTKILSLVFGSAVHAFALILAAFLLGLGLGSALLRRVLERARDPWLFLAGLELVVGLSALAFLPLTGLYPFAYLALFRLVDGAYGGLLACEFLLALLALLPATLCIGATFPAVARIYAVAPATLARRLGAAYAVNTVGAIAGSLAAGFWLVPTLGVYWTTVLGAGVNLLLAAVAVLLGAAPLPRRLALAAVPLAAGLVLIPLLPRWDPGLMTSGVHTYAPVYLKAEGGMLAVKGRRELLYYKEGLNGFVTVEAERDRPQVRSLLVNGKSDASTLTDMRTQMLLGHLPCLFHARPSSALVIGLGSGITVHSAALHPVDVLDVVEIEDAVREASEFFVAENGGVLRDRRVRLHVDDGRNYVRASGRRWDVIVSEPSNPWLSGPSHLFTREAFAELRRALKPGGVIAQWIQCYALDEALGRTLVRTFTSVFPHVLLYADPLALGDVILLGSEEPLTLDLPRLDERVARAGVGAELRGLGLERPAALLGGLLLGEADVVRFGAGARLNTDDLPIVEFEAPRWLHRHELAERLYRALLGARREDALPLAGRTLDPAEAAHLTARFVRLLRDHQLRDEAVRLLERGLARQPGDPELRLLAALVRGRTVDALSLDELAEVVRRDPTNPGMRLTYGRALLSAGRPQEALLELREALARGGRSSEVLTLAGAAFIACDQLADARDVLVEAVRLAPDQVYAWATLARVEERRGDYSAAIAALERVIALERDPAKRAQVEARRELLRRGK
ncbi:MAG: hypothetical protein HZA54_06690 [Planctomycetes bacterium]|nr:hypothetical protein [Planctomycetota bacterium]